jgi:hypothetical protein
MKLTVCLKKLIRINLIFNLILSLSVFYLVSLLNKKLWLEFDLSTQDLFFVFFGYTIMIFIVLFTKVIKRPFLTEASLTTFLLLNLFLLFELILFGLTCKGELIVYIYPSVFILSLIISILILYFKYKVIFYYSLCTSAIGLLIVIFFPFLFN